MKKLFLAIVLSVITVISTFAEVEYTPREHLTSLIEASIKDGFFVAFVAEADSLEELYTELKIDIKKLQLQSADVESRSRATVVKYIHIYTLKELYFFCDVEDDEGLSRTYVYEP